mmetsp:Transcript_8116/g.9305  ORF Transcript_8116/g.9305 Transcript_8116/m.9305 type:complete len:258 (+) Transcript_8116:228-1001(+)|eukprot:CAMPEP_0184025808 /NCGR_PEP_ID=MMETSP0954-20121128/13070_1 /TAXON_ID=627963 /ORGANISM="Aplanochytrium sp, Strain PBS07" /LENGTH=257 /DNA_ID=CAMNT_0026309741 /DNA_START=157 /DNA_END=930 /DNA_ORIENTATION=+
MSDEMSNEKKDVVLRKPSAASNILEKAITKRAFLRCDLTEQQDINYVYKHTHRGSWRRTWIKRVNTRRFQILLGLLLILDVLVLMGQIFLDAHFPPCDAIENNAQCLNGTFSTFEPVCTNEDNKYLYYTHKVFYGISLAILSTFEIELIFLMFILGLYGFFRNFAYILDLLIITFSLVLEVMLHNTESGAAVGLLILARLWRFVRISHGILFSNTKRRHAVAELIDDLSIYDSDWSVGRDDEFDINPEDDGEREHHH